MFLEELRLEGCHSIDDISPELLPRARYLRVESCPNLTKFLIHTATESVSIRFCCKLENLWVAVGTLPSALTYLNIWNCEKLKWLPEMELFHLQVLQINDCKKLVNGVKEWCLQRLPCLRELAIKHNGSDQHWELPSSIRRLEGSFPPLFLSYVYMTIMSSIHYIFGTSLRFYI
ncbi:hypothetical protein KY284_008492 [Solanum tuberosum]|nr:hypothetical protein KY284_008492 [Solanum tuberosum]